MNPIAAQQLLAYVAAHRHDLAAEIAAARRAAQIRRTKWRRKPTLATRPHTGHASDSDAVDAVVPRLAVPGDAHEIVRLRQLMFHAMGVTSIDSTWLVPAEQHLTRAIASDHTVAVVVDAPRGGLAGCGVIEFQQRIPSPSNPTGRTGYVSTVSTDPDWRHRGIARAVLVRLLAEAEHRATGRVELHATPDGIDLYRTAGFVELETGREMRRHAAATSPR